MAKAKHKKKHKKKKHIDIYTSVFPPLFPKFQSIGPTPSPSMGGHISAPGGAGVVPGGGGGVAGIGENKLPPTKIRILHEMRKIFEAPNPVWTGYSAPSPAVVTKQNTPQPTGQGFQPVNPGQGPFDFKNSPGLGFRSQKAWRVWHAALDILTKAPTLPISAVLQAANVRAGVKYGDLDAGEVRLLEMGLQWYLSDPDKFTNNKRPDQGGYGGFGATQFNGTVG